MTEILIYLLILVISAIIVVTTLHSLRSSPDTKTRARARIRLHQIRRTRQLDELRLAMQRDARQLRRALDRDFDALDEE